jgi:uncharacterized protein (TIGR02266 family)
MAGERRERRGHFRGKPRPGRRVEVSFSASDGAPRRAHTRDIGVGGAFVVTTTPEPPGTRLTLSVHVPTASEPIQVRGEVRWVTPGGVAGAPPGMGLRFEALEVESLLQLGEYFASLTGREEAAS